MTQEHDMAGVAGIRRSGHAALSASRIPALPWVLLAFGLAALYLPTFRDLFNGLWRTDQNGHGPIVLAVAVWYLLHKSKEIAKDDMLPRNPAPVQGWAVLVFGVLLYILGRSQAIYLFEVGSLIPVVAGIVLLFFGAAILRRLWFGFFFMAFMVPLPGSITDTLTQPMKIAVSWGAEHVLYGLGFPVSRNGVILNVGQYQLLVADACAGLNSLFTLEALGLLYMNVMRHTSALRNIMLAVFIVPISFSANLTRVMVLALITYYWGDAAGQGFLHEFSGMVLFMTALLLIISMDGMLRAISAKMLAKPKAAL